MRQRGQVWAVGIGALVVFVMGVVGSADNPSCLYWAIGVPVVGALIGIALITAGADRKRKALTAQIEAQVGVLGAIVTQKFLLHPCFTCQETEMRLIEVSPKGRSVHYQCTHCSAKMRAPAGAPGAEEAPTAARAVASLSEQLRQLTERPVNVTLLFETVSAPLPYEETTREPIPAGVRAEVWRRDQGKCVTCGSNQNLQFDHIIPIASGGATSFSNLQLLCKQCNLTKSARI